MISLALLESIEGRTEVKEVMRAILIFCASVVFILLLESTLSRGVSPNEVAIVIDAEFESGGRLSAYFNSDWQRPSSLPIKPGQREKYTLNYNRPVWSQSSWLTDVRLNLFEQPDTTIKIHSVAFFNRKERVEWSGEKVLQSAHLTRVIPLGIEGSAGVFRVSSSESNLIVRPNLLSLPDSFLEVAVRGGLQFMILGSSIFLFVFIFSLEMKKQAPLASRVAYFLCPLLLFFSVLLVPLAVDLRDKLPALYQSVSFAVGNSTFFGYPKGTDFLHFFACVLVSVTLGGSFAAITRLLVGALKSGGLNSIGGKSIHLDIALRYIHPPLLTVFLLVFCLGDFSASLEFLSSPPFIFYFDELNIFSWRYLFHEGFLPFRDFWYPYGFSIISHGGLSISDGLPPLGNLAGFLHSMLQYFLLFVTLSLLMRGERVVALFVVLSIIFLESTSVLSTVYRYLVSLNVTLFFGALLFCVPTFLWGVLFGVFFGYGFVYEPSQVVYATPACAFLLLYKLFLSARDQFWREKSPPLFGGLIGAFGSFGVLVFVLWRENLLPGFVRVYSRLGTTAIYGALPADIDLWLSHPTVPQGVVLVGTLLLFAFGSYFFLSFEKGHLRDSSAVIVGIALTSLAIFGKQLTRPHVAEQLLVHILVGGLLTVYLFRNRWDGAQRTVGVVWLGVLCSTLLTADMRNFFEQRFSSATGRILLNIEALMFPQEVVREKYRYFFSEERLSAVYPIIPAFARFRAEFEETTGSEPKFFVLGDESFLYNVFRQKPPYFLSIYNSSDVRDQRDIIEWIESEKPPIVVWNPCAESFFGGPNFFDDVPNVVRVPLLFRHVMKHYRKVQEEEGFWFLIRDEGGGDYFDDWQRVLGSEVDLGAIPNLSSIEEYPRCISTEEVGCRLVIRITRDVARSKEGEEIQILLGGGSSERTVVFKALPGFSTAFIRLDRLWFVPRDSWLSSVRVKTPSEGVSAGVESRLLPDTLLY